MERVYNIGLRCGGLMEDPEWHIKMIRPILADSLESAIDKWAEITGENKKSTWNATFRTVWGWSVVDAG